MDNPKKNFYDLSFDELNQFITESGEPGFRTSQIWKGMYENLFETPLEITTLPQKLKDKLLTAFKFNTLNASRKLNSEDGLTTKILFDLEDGKSIETVLMGYDQRRTLCISTQSGCAMGCVFCATGQMGFKRNLSNGEIIEQVLFFARQLKSINEKVTNIVIMGMGEPFHNYENTIKAVDSLNDSRGYNFGERRFTISTVGLTPIIDQFTNDHRQINLAISLHAANDKLRSSLLPINKKHPVAELIKACRNYTDQTHRRITFEYALINGVNDSAQNASELVQLIKGMLCHVNLIPLNPTHKYNGKGSAPNTAQVFSEILQKAGITTTIRIRRGIDIQAGCGQLASEVKN